MASPSTLAPEFEVLEQATTRVRCILTYEDGLTPLPGSLLSSLSMRILGPDLTTVLVAARNILNQNNATVDECGEVLLTLSPSDMAMADSTLPNERHLIQLVWTWNLIPVKVGRAEIALVLRNLALVP